MPNNFGTIYLRNLQLSAVVGQDAWGRANKPQPLVLSLRLCRDTLGACVSDQILDTFSYGQICKEVTAAIDGKNFSDLDAIIFIIEDLSQTWAGESLHCEITLPKGLLRVEGGLRKETVMLRIYEQDEEDVENAGWGLASSQCKLRNIKTACIIGVNSHERLEKQAVSIDICIPERIESNSVRGRMCSVDQEKGRNIVSMTIKASNTSWLQILDWSMG